MTPNYSPEEREIRNKLKPIHQEARTKNLKPKWKGMKLIVNETTYEYNRQTGTVRSYN